MPIAPILLQLAATTAGAAPSSGPLPDIVFQARVRAKEVRIQQSGEASLEVRADPPLEERVVVERNRPADGRTVVRDLDLRLDAKASVADPRSPEPASATAPPAGAEPAPGEGD